MIVATQDNSILNLVRYDALEMVYQGYYDRSEYTISAIIFDADGKVSVEDTVCQFRSKDEANDYLKNVETDTSYIRIPTKATSLTPKSLTLLNLARFHALEFVVNDAPAERIAGKMMTSETLPRKTRGTVRAIQYDAFGAELKTVGYSEQFKSKEAAVDWFNQLAERRTTS